MKRYVINLSYDGTFFSGWQIQNEGRTIQDVLEKALTKIAKTGIKVVGSGRTDAGVHALNQYAHFDFPIPIQIRASLVLLASGVLRLFHGMAFSLMV